MLAYFKLVRVVGMIAALGLSASYGRDVRALSMTFVCFYAPESTELSPRCLKVIAEFADHWRSVRDGRRISDFGPHREGRAQIEGHSFRERGGIDLARRRGILVAHELTRLGVPEDLIDVEARNDRPWLPGDASNTQNRRFNIVLR